MPSVDGIEATRAIARRATPDAQVVVLTSFADRERILDALDAGAIGYLLKDAEPDELIGGDPRGRARRVAARPEGGARAARRPRRAASRAELSDREREVLGWSRRACRTS